jgi:hypothetical protein
MIKKIIKILGLRAILATIEPMIEEIIHKSIKNDQIRAVILAIFDTVLDVVRVMTNDNKDNSEEVKMVLMRRIPELLLLLQGFQNREED